MDKDHKKQYNELIHAYIKANEDHNWDQAEKIFLEIKKFNEDNDII